MGAERTSAWKGFVAGAIGGVVGTLVLNLFQKGSLEATRAVESRKGWQKPYTREQEALQKMFQRAHLKTARAAGMSVPWTGRERTAAAVEFAFGVVCAGAYGAVAEYVPEVRAWFGTAYGATLFAGASEAVLPALGWVPAPGDRTVVQHAGGLAGNMVYGAVTEGVRLLLREMLSASLARSS